MEHGQAPPSGRFIAIQGGGHDRFGAVADLAVFREQARDLAVAYAIRLGITEQDFLTDPDVTVTCIGLALCRQEEMLLQQGIQRDLADRAEQLGGDYGMALYTATKNAVHERHQRAIDKAHQRATRYREELELLIRKRGRLTPAKPQPS
jgi:hypothetical protein